MGGTFVGGKRIAGGASVSGQSGNGSTLMKAENKPCLIKTGTNTLSVVAGTSVQLESGAVSFATQTPITMPGSPVAGEDYAVFVRPDGTAVAVADPFNSPASAPATGAIKIGGYHYGLVASGTTLSSGSFATSGSGMVWTQNDVDAIAGINAFSIWDLLYRPSCDPRGMTCVKTSEGRPVFWFDIYLCSTAHITNGTSKYNTDVASGTVLPLVPLMFGGNGSIKYSHLYWYEAQEIAQSHGKHLLTHPEFCAAAFGVTEGQSLGGASSTIPATARQAGYTSKWGGEQMSGHHWIWGEMAHGAGGSAWSSGPGRGQSYGTPYAALFGGDRNSASSSGSRCSAWSNSAWNSNWSIGLRASCDSCNLWAGA
jgi:hypothetical protein